MVWVGGRKGGERWNPNHSSPFHSSIPPYNTPLSIYASVPAINNLKSRLVLCCAIHLLYFLAPSLDFRLLFAGTEV